MTCAEALDLVSAMLDRELSVGDMLRLEHHLAGCRACRAVRASESWLHSLLAAGALAEQPPPALVAQVRERIALEAGRSRSRLLRWRRAFLPALVGGLLSAGAAAALWIHVESTREWAAIVADAAEAHRQYGGAAAHVALEIPGTDRARLDRWLQLRLGPSVDLPANADAGEPLLGARPAIVAGGTAAQVVYGGRGGHLSLFVVARPRHRPPEEGERIIDGIEVYTDTLGTASLGWWEHGNHLYLAVSSAGDEEILELAARCLRAQRALHDQPGPLGLDLAHTRPDVRSALAASA